MENKKLVSLLLRIGIAFSFFYAAIASFINPTNWIGFFPSFLQSYGILITHSVFEIALGLWLISGWKTFYAAALSAIFMFGIIFFNFGAMDIIFRDITILFSTIALCVLNYGKK